MITNAIRQLLEAQPLTEKEAEAVMEQIMGGEATPAQIAGFLIAYLLFPSGLCCFEIMFNLPIGDSGAIFIDFG